MAKFLIYNKTHYYDLPSRLEPAKTDFERLWDNIDGLPIPELEKLDKKIKLQDSYDRKSILGDIVEIREDDNHLCKKELDAYILIYVDVDISTARQYQVAAVDGATILHKFKYNLDISGITVNPVTKEATLTLSNFLSRLTDKTSVVRSLEIG